jgi:hypothetical protein
MSQAGFGDERVPVPPTEVWGVIIGLTGSSTQAIGERIIGHYADKGVEKFYRFGPDLVYVLGGGYLHKNDRHIIGCLPAEEPLALIHYADKPGTTVLVGYIDEYLKRYGQLSYSM